MSEAKDIYLSELAKIKQLGWIMLAAIGAAALIGFILFITILKKSPENQTLNILKQQQQFFDSLSKEQKKTAEQDRLRDSTNWDTFIKNSTQRNLNVSNYRKQSNDKIEHFSNPDFTNDSIRRAFAN